MKGHDFGMMMGVGCNVNYCLSLCRSFHRVLEFKCINCVQHYADGKEKLVYIFKFISLLVCLLFSGYCFKWHDHIASCYMAFSQPESSIGYSNEVCPSPLPPVPVYIVWLDQRKASSNCLYHLLSQIPVTHF